MSKNLCPFLKKPCMEHDCMLYTHIAWTHPQTGLSEDKHACSLALIPIMLVENARKTGGVQAAVENTRNEICQRQDVFNNLALEAKNQRKAITED